MMILWSMVIGICAPSGGGKTSLITVLLNKIPGSRVIHFDDYGDPFHNIAEFDRWIRSGADLNAVSADRLSADLKKLAENRSDREEIVLFDTLVGRGHEETGSLIDYLIYIDVPLELALSRRILRMIEENDDEVLREKLKDFLEAYSGETGPRQIYGAIQRQNRDRADLLIGREGDVESIASEILSRLKGEFPDLF